MAACRFPIMIHNPNFGFEAQQTRLMLVPCGKCSSCLKRRRKEWVFRLENEVADSRYSMFLTLTYNDTICDNELHRNDLLLYIKRLRYEFGKLRYYAIGEFGSKTGRPHYHMLLFFKEDHPVFQMRFNEVHDLLARKWHFGMIQSSGVTSRRISYILHYHVRPKTYPNHQTRCFSLSSKGLGMSFMDDNVKYQLDHSPSNLVMSKSGTKVPLPRYYRKKYDIAAKEFTPRADAESIVQYCLRTGIDIEEYKQALRELDKRELNKYNVQESV